VDDLTVVQIDLASKMPICELEHTGLPADADELNDVG
jgi:hypothetical protein